MFWSMKKSQCYRQKPAHYGAYSNDICILLLKLLFEVVVRQGIEHFFVSPSHNTAAKLRNNIGINKRNAKKNLLLC